MKTTTKWIMKRVKGYFFLWLDRSFATNLDEPMTVESLLCAPRPSPPCTNTHTPHTHIQDKPGVLPSKKKGKRKEETSGAQK